MYQLNLIRGCRVSIRTILLLWFFASCTAQCGPQRRSVWAQEDLNCVEIARRVPPIGLEATSAQRVTWQQKTVDLQQQLAVYDSPHEADIAVLLKACEFAIDFQEFYRESDFAKVDRLLELAAQRLVELGSDNPSWTSMQGRQVRGFRSNVDGSVQPVGLVFSKSVSRTGRSVPLYVWLHGRGDKVTDLHFICERLDKDGQVAPEGVIVLHPFGRQCVGYKSAGETDVMEAIDFVCENYPVDRRRIVLMGFSMGGAGVWHLAAHYGQHFVAASPGAGFAETARYQGLTPEQFPAKYEQLLWSIYDVPGYTRNLFNFPVVAYSGEVDKQIQAARVMEGAFRDEGRELTHLIGPGMGHKYHPDTLAQILVLLSRAVEEGQPQQPDEIRIQTRHPRYASRQWVAIDGASKQYSDTRVDAVRGAGGWKVETKNVSRLRLDCSLPGSPTDEIEIDGQAIPLRSGKTNLLTRNNDHYWQRVDQFLPLRKRPGISGPIDDAFIDPFLVVLPSESGGNSRVDQWVNCELEHFQSRWKALFRGQLRSKRDMDVTRQDMERFHLVLWGTPNSNTLIARLFAPTNAPKLPLAWNSQVLSLGNENFDVENHVPLLIYPNPSQPDKYVVLNSGPTFREAHDRTNSLQNPHLPDWAIISLVEPPSAERPGKVRRAGFFDAAWQIDEELLW